MASYIENCFVPLFQFANGESADLACTDYLGKPLQFLRVETSRSTILKVLNFPSGKDVRPDPDHLL